MWRFIWLSRKKVWDWKTKETYQVKWWLGARSSWRCYGPSSECSRALSSTGYVILPSVFFREQQFTLTRSWIEDLKTIVFREFLGCCSPQSVISHRNGVRLVLWVSIKNFILIPYQVWGSKSRWLHWAHNQLNILIYSLPQLLINSTGEKNKLYSGQSFNWLLKYANNFRVVSTRWGTVRRRWQQSPASHTYPSTIPFQRNRRWDLLFNTICL